MSSSFQDPVLYTFLLFSITVALVSESLHDVIYKTLMKILDKDKVDDTMEFPTAIAAGIHALWIVLVGDYTVRTSEFNYLDVFFIASTAILVVPNFLSLIGKFYYVRNMKKFENDKERGKKVTFKKFMMSMYFLEIVFLVGFIITILSQLYINGRVGVDDLNASMYSMNVAIGSILVVSIIILLGHSINRENKYITAENFLSVKGILLPEVNLNTKKLSKTGKLVRVKNKYEKISDYNTALNVLAISTIKTNRRTNISADNYCIRKINNKNYIVSPNHAKLCDKLIGTAVTAEDGTPVVLSFDENLYGYVKGSVDFLNLDEFKGVVTWMYLPADILGSLMGFIWLSSILYFRNAVNGTIFWIIVTWPGLFLALRAGPIGRWYELFKYSYLIGFSLIVFVEYLFPNSGRYLKEDIYWNFTDSTVNTDPNSDTFVNDLTSTTLVASFSMVIVVCTFIHQIIIAVAGKSNEGSSKDDEENASLIGR